MCLISYSQEICTNSIDDDGDGLIDLQDSTDCVCGIGQLGPIPSFIPNPSFENFTACPSSNSESFLLEDWLQATAGTTDYLNTCGFTFNAEPAGLLPFPDGNGVVGTFFLDDFKEYVGTCLPEPLLPGQSYTLNFYIAASMTGNDESHCLGPIDGVFPAVDLTIFGAASCSDIPIFTFLCPSAGNNAWSALGSVNYNPVQSWSNLSITFTPNEPISTIMLGSACFLGNLWSASIANNCRPYFYWDDLVLNTTSSFEVVIGPITADLCQTEIVLQSNLTSSQQIDGDIQWFNDGIAIPGETGLTLNLPAQTSSFGTYQVGIFGAVACAVAENFIVNELPALPTANFLLPDEDAFVVGKTADFSNLSSNYETILWNACEGVQSIDSILTLSFLEQGECCIDLIAFLGGCSDIFTQCIEVIAEPELQIPNIITPNSDGLNDTFSISSKGYISLSCEIFNRWGKNVYSWQNDLNGNWDGAAGSTEISSGQYYYVLSYIDFQENSGSVSGTLTVIRD